MGKEKIDMSSAAVTARIKRACEPGNFTMALRAARSAAARAKLQRLDIKTYPQPKAERSRQERE